MFGKFFLINFLAKSGNSKHFSFFFHFFPKKVKLWSLCLTGIYKNSGHYVCCHLHNSSGMCLNFARPKCLVVHRYCWSCQSWQMANIASEDSHQPKCTIKWGGLAQGQDYWGAVWQPHDSQTAGLWGLGDGGGVIVLIPAQSSYLRKTVCEKGLDQAEQSVHVHLYFVYTCPASEQPALCAAT